MDTKLAPPSATSIQTVNGRYIDLLNPTVDMIDLDDIVTAAQRIIRFTGHSLITLAEHSCRVHDIVAMHFEVDDQMVRRAALLHDAHEVYCGDASSPLKIAMRHHAYECGGVSDFDCVEYDLAAVVAERFAFPNPHPAIVKEADTIALAIEADKTWGTGTAESWGLPKPPDGFVTINDDMRRRYRRTTWGTT